MRDTVELLASEFGVKVEIEEAAIVEERLQTIADAQPDDPACWNYGRR